MISMRIRFLNKIVRNNKARCYIERIILVGRFISHDVNLNAKNLSRLSRQSVGKLLRVVTKIHDRREFTRTGDIGRIQERRISNTLDADRQSIFTRILCCSRYPAQSETFGAAMTHEYMQRYSSSFKIRMFRRSMKRQDTYTACQKFGIVTCSIKRKSLTGMQVTIILLWNDYLLEYLKTALKRR